MKLSLDWLKDYVDLPDLSVRQIMHDLTMATVEVEAAKDCAESLANVVVGRVIGAAKHAASERLAVVNCDVGHDRVLQIVCRAEEALPGMLVAVALPGARIRLQENGEISEVREQVMSGIRSDAQICVASELGLEGLFPDSADVGILDISETSGAVGAPLATTLGWDDVVLEIDNKSLTNRPDLWGHYGVARELAAIYGRTLNPPPRLLHAIPPGEMIGAVNLSACQRFTLVRVVVPEAGVAPLWLRSRLARVGQRSISFFADLTNYVMYGVGQPAHAYEAAGSTLPVGVRFGKLGEAIQLLDGKTHQLDEYSLVVTVGDQPAAAAGVMGGERSSVSRASREALIELATFDALTIRKSATHLGLRTEASSRFEKALDTNIIDHALGLLSELIAEVSPQAQLVEMHDVVVKETKRKTIPVKASFIQNRLGKELSRCEIVKRLTSLGFVVNDISDDDLSVLVPTWRSTGDISMPHDLLEEVARLYGYDNFNFSPPNIALVGPSGDSRLLLERRCKELLASVGGMQEIVTYPWTRQQFIEAAGIDCTEALRLASAPAPDQAILQPSLIPGLLEAVALNQRFYEEFRIMLSGSTFDGSSWSTPDDKREFLPRMRRYIVGALVGKEPQLLFREAKGLVEALGRNCRIAELKLASGGEKPWADPKSRLAIVTNGRVIGAIGIVSARTRRLSGIRVRGPVVFELEVSALEPLSARLNEYQAIPLFPEVEADLSLVFKDDVLWADIAELAKHADGLIRSISYIGEYRGSGIPAGKRSITLRIRLGADDRTLRADEVHVIVDKVRQSLYFSFEAEQR